MTGGTGTGGASGPGGVSATSAAISTANDLWGPDWPDVRAMWPLEPTVAHLDHGAFGAVPRPVLEEQQSWRDRMESNPVRFLSRELPGAIEEARAEVAHFLGTEAERLAFVANARAAVNTVLSCFPLAQGDEVLLTDHVFGAVEVAARQWTVAAGARVEIGRVPLAAGDDEVLEAMLSAVTDRTRLAVLEHITSPTARRLPLDTLIPALKERGVAVLVDGALATAMVRVELDRLGADYYAANLHKWACAPRGTGVLYVSAARRHELRPLVAFWGEARGFPGAFDNPGTQDATAWLSAGRALRTLDHLGFDRLRKHNVELAVAGQRTVAAAVDVPPDKLPRDPGVSMQLVPLQAGLVASHAEAARLRLLISEQAGVEVGVTTWRGQGFLRLSAHAYNAPGDYARLAAALPAVLASYAARGHSGSSRARPPEPTSASGSR